MILLFLASLCFTACKKEYDEYTLLETSTESSGEVINFMPGSLGEQLSPSVPTITLNIEAAEACECQGLLGTNVLIPENAFVDQEGLSVDGIIDVEIIEALTKGDLIRTNRSTLANGQLMISSGGVFLKARKGEELLQLAEGKEIRIELPFTGDPATQYPGLKLYTGVTTETGFDWEEVEDSEVNIGETQVIGETDLKYSFNFSSTDWYACLHPYQSSQWTDFNLATPSTINDKNSALFLSFKDQFSLVQISEYSEGGFSTPIQVPAGVEVTLIGLAEIDGQFYATSTDISLAESISEAIVFESMTIESINELLDSLE